MRSNQKGKLGCFVHYLSGGKFDVDRAGNLLKAIVEVYLDRLSSNVALESVVKTQYLGGLLGLIFLLRVMEISASLSMNWRSSTPRYLSSPFCFDKQTRLRAIHVFCTTSLHIFIAYYRC